MQSISPIFTVLRLQHWFLKQKLKQQAENNKAGIKKAACKADGLITQKSGLNAFSHKFNSTENFVI